MVFGTNVKSVPEVSETFKEIMKAPERVFEMFWIDMKSACERAVTEMIKAELSGFLGRGKFERKGEKARNYRNGSCGRKYTVKNVGTLNIDIARDRKGEFSSKLIRKYDRYEERYLEPRYAIQFLNFVFNC